MWPSGLPFSNMKSKGKWGLQPPRKKQKRTKKVTSPSHNTFDPLQDLRDWTEYAASHKPVLTVNAKPQLRETFLSQLGHELTPAIVMYAGGARWKFKTDFYRMKLLCGGKEVEPIQPGKAATVVNAHNSFVNVTDATYVGIYSYPPEAISPSCGKVTLQLYSEKEPDKSESKDLEQKSIERVWNDFRPYLAAH